jgi:alkylation response protein AidB-like acyl-CoA dehydrogenase
VAVKLKDSDRHIVDGIADLLDGAGGLPRVRRLQAESSSFDPALWTKLAELGWLGAAVPEVLGGSGLELREILLLLEHAGKKLMPEPLVLALAGSMILARSSAPHAAELLASVIAGKTICVPVEPEPGADTPKADAVGRLDARTGYVSDGHVGDHFLMLVEREGELQSCAVARNAPGLAVESRATVDGGSITRLRCEGVKLSDHPILSRGLETAAVFTAARDFTRLGYAALLTGLMDEALQITVQYLKDRRQFGVPIGSFQALQHRAASLYVTAKASRALVYEASRAADTPHRSIAALAAKSYAADTAMQTVKECVQLHGAMGYTAEHNMSLYFRRAMALAVAGGDAVTCRKLFHAERELTQDA